GLSEEQIALIHSAAADIPVFFSANMSLGINLMLELCKKAASILGGSFDIEILERHHNQKIDAPSGTALMLADALRDGLEYSPKYVLERHSRREKREAEEIGISAIRGGTIVGEHEIIFAGHDEVFTISHAAHSKEIFANGALNAAFYLKGKAPGMYAMKDLVEAR
ncbi:MAG: 4-hydroxy-tetrahydrodipicolinate reductase, partial [Oscillospiraceae bacterium]|nr:4-hydroxy-tetrahydrodipicolinate reductase [Oscillospiraceae bacterium]